jgi:hypothetical protein
MKSVIIEKEIEEMESVHLNVRYQKIVRNIVGIK